jgi:hypothetical protein
VIADEVLYGLLGLTTTDERKSRIMEGLGIGEEKAEALIMDLKELFGDTLIQNDQGTKGAPVPQPPLQPQKTVNPGPLPTANTDLKERLHLRPETAKEQPAFSGAGVTKPLTREELMGSLSAKRTMASDIAAVKGAEGGGLKSATGVPPTGQPPEKK